MADWASESGHFYDAKTGEPRYRIVGANGVERDTNLGDLKRAAKRGETWVPGATTVMKCAYKWQLENWKANQLLIAGLTIERPLSIPLEHLVSFILGREELGPVEAAWLKRVHEKAEEIAKKAAERGTEIHAAVETYFASDRKLPYHDDSTWPWVASISRLIEQEFGQQTWCPEKSFAHPLGYGGKVDLHSDAVLIDFKGKEAKNGVRDWGTYPEHAMQLAAYAEGLRLTTRKDSFNQEYPETWPRCGIIFFDRNEPYAEWHEVKPVELERGWRMFEALLAYWKASNL